MRVVFMGTPAVAVPSLEAVLASRHDVVGVVTQPDKPKGRSGALVAPPVKDAALAAGVEVLQPRSPKDDGFADTLAGLTPEALAVVAYGHILPRAVLAVAPAMNVHFSLLPAYRGAAPVQRALMDGAERTGVSVFLLEPTVDTGPVVATEAIAVGPEETAGDVFDRLAPIGARLLVTCLDGLEAGTLQPVVQDDAAASPAPKIDPAEARIDWTLPAAAIVNRIRGLSPAPGAHTSIAGKRLTVYRARIAPVQAAPGTVVSADPLIIAAGESAVEVLEVQMEGKRRLSATEFVRGRRFEPGQRLG